MRTWKELESEFKQLSHGLRDMRIDVQWGAAGIHTRLAGFYRGDGSQRNRFYTLAGIAGKMVREHRLGIAIEEIQNASSDFDAWCFALKNLSPGYCFGNHGEQKNASGEHAGFIYSGSIPNASEESANVCLLLESDATTHNAERIQNLAGSSGAAFHLKAAHEAAEKSPPDVAEMARSAISALEAVARLACNTNTATLGACTIQLRSENRLHPALRKTIDGLWGFSNESPGVRHGSDELPTITLGEARYVLESCEAAIRFLSTID